MCVYVSYAPAQVDFFEDGALEIDVVEEAEVKADLIEAGVAQAGAAQVAVLEVLELEVDAAEVGADEVEMLDADDAGGRQGRKRGRELVAGFAVAHRVQHAEGIAMQRRAARFCANGRDRFGRQRASRLATWRRCEHVHGAQSSLASADCLAGGAAT